ncbi:hypothetical protein R1sor_013426 [Riccia sorocarpa]|uniref:RING-type domain-containing protein n=1 Tax=Riccia sorocarpa TaxID=122646 RepID=A0ABD3H9G4_9MARC
MHEVTRTQKFPLTRTDSLSRWEDIDQPGSHLDSKYIDRGHDQSRRKDQPVHQQCTRGDRLIAEVWVVRVLLRVDFIGFAITKMSCPQKGQVSLRHPEVIDTARSRLREKSVLPNFVVFRNLGSRYGCNQEGSKDHSPGQIGKCSRASKVLYGEGMGEQVHLEKERSVCRPLDFHFSVKDEQPEECPICTEALDATDKSFASCPCGFKLCLFCHHTIKANDGRCPGCRMIYKTAKVSRSKRK